MSEAGPAQVLHYMPELVGRFRARGTPRPWGPRLPGLSEMLRDLPLLEVCALQWRWCVESVIRDAGLLGDRLLTVRLEDLDEQAVREIHRHSGLSREGLEPMLEQFRSRYDSSKTHGRFSALPLEQQARIEAMIEPTMKLLNYV
jgi:hypothetical protein